jgi:hypothetical protein
MTPVAVRKGKSPVQGPCDEWDSVVLQTLEVL